MSSLADDYERVTDYIRYYVDFVMNVIQVSIFGGGFIKGLRFLFISGKWLRKKDLLSPKNYPPKKYSEALRSALGSSERSERIKNHTFFNIWVSDSPPEALRENLHSQFPNVDFKRLYEIHLLREANIRYKQPQLRNTIGVIFACCTIILNITPVELINKIPIINYGDFKILAFSVTLIFALFVLTFVLPRWLRHRKALNEFQMVGYFLKYVEISSSYIKSKTEVEQT